MALCVDPNETLREFRTLGNLTTTEFRYVDKRMPQDNICHQVAIDMLVKN